MHHKHIVARFLSCPISVTLGEREAGQSKGDHEELAQIHPHGQSCNVSELTLL